MDFLCTTCMFLFLYPSANIISGIDQYYHQLRSVRVSNAKPTAKSKGSLVQCAAHCSQNDDCWIAQWHANDELCEMFDYKLTISLVYPTDTGNSTTTVLFGKPISVVYVQKNAGYFDFTEATDACTALGGDITDYLDMKGGHDADWLHVSGCSFMDTQYKYCPTQSYVAGCGNGLSLCGYGDTADVLCTLDGYAGFV